MASKRSLLEQMRDSPAGGWTIKDVTTLCNQEGLIFKPPSRGSHHKVMSDLLHGAITVPYKRPIKAFYIKQIVSFAEAHIQERKRRSESPKQ